MTMSVDSTEIISHSLEVLERIVLDGSVPRNIRRSADNVKKILSRQDESPAVRAALSIVVLEEISNDPNIPLHTRTLIWNLASQLETIPING